MTENHFQCMRVSDSKTFTVKTVDLQFFLTSEGFYDYKKDQYIYQYKDHLGNVRVSFARNSAGALEITDNNDYYPFGMNHLKSGNAFFGQNSYKSHKYNGKELQETGMYDYGARMYMADIGRWGVVDQLSEMYSFASPYAYVANNPIMMFDPDGMRIMASNGGPDKEGNLDPDQLGGTNNPYLIEEVIVGQQYLMTPPVQSQGLLNFNSTGNAINIPKSGGNNVGQPGAWEGAIPIWGSGRAAVDHFQNGNYWRGAAYTALAVSDVFLVKSLAVGAGKLAVAGFGKIAAKETAEQAAKTGTNLVEQTVVHGNSLKSLKPTWGYKLYLADGTFLKNGITSAVKAESRYTKSFMSDKYMEKVLFPNRKAAYDWEFLQNQIFKGPLNKNMH
ncbi:RHS repeat domain-containing protein [Chryseobacterium sp.]|uniref:RHS repeat domain-containing protein n=1 Tax=Chryseobacterium sp. TaxID=1871047 RepID=UPI002FC5AF21